MRLSRESGIPLVATNDCHYLTQADARAQEVLMCIQTGKTMSDAQRMRFATDQFYFKTAEEMAQVFGELPEALERTVAIAERCNLRIEPVRNSFPDFKVPEGHTLDSYFERVVREGFAERVPFLEALPKQGRLRQPLAEYERRLTDEIKMIKQMRYAGLFPDRLGFHSLRARAGHSGGAGPRLGGRQPGRATRCASPTSIRCNTICCSSASSIPSAFRCPISTSISACGGAAK